MCQVIPAVCPLAISGMGGFKGSAFERVAEGMRDEGFAFDDIPDRHLSEAIFKGGAPKTSGSKLAFR